MLPMPFRVFHALVDHAAQLETAQDRLRASLREVSGSSSEALDFVAHRVRRPGQAVA